MNSTTRSRTLGVVSRLLILDYQSLATLDASCLLLTGIEYSSSGKLQPVPVEASRTLAEGSRKGLADWA